MPSRRLVAAASAGLLLACAPAEAALLARYATLDGSVVAGAAVDAYVDFEADYLLDTLTISIHNLSLTPSNGQLLDGIAFNLTGAQPNVTIAGVVAPQLNTNATTSAANADITGSWLLGTPYGGYASGFSGGDGPLTINAVDYAYTLGAAAFSGAGSVFAASDFTLGGGGDDYTIVGSGTNLTTSNVNKYPVAFGSVRITLNGFTASPSQTVSGVAFLFGSGPAGTAGGQDETPVPAPEPGSLALFAGALGMLAIRRRRAG